MSHPSYPPLMRRLINELSKLPSVGEKSASRLAYYLVTTNRSEAERLAETIKEAREGVRLCEECFSLAEEKICPICSDATRDGSVMCVVEKPADVIAIERAGGYRGLYHVLHGLWSPLKGVRPEETTVGALVARVRAAKESPRPVEEIILATSTTVEGDATALFIANNVEQLGVKVTRIAQGMPKGGELEYADEVTLTHAISGRRGL